MALANVALTDTFDVWRIRTNQVITNLGQVETSGIGSYNKANAANVIASSAFNKANSTTYSSNVVIATTDNTNAAFRITQTGTGAALLVEDNTNPDSTSFIVNSDGNVGIGTLNPATKLHIVNSDSTSVARIAGASFAIRFQSIANTGAYINATDITESTYQPLYIGGSNTTFTIAGSNVGRWTSTGLGIGTLNPSSTLNVVGEANISGSLLINTVNVGSVINSSFNKANDAGVIASTAFNKANAANVLAFNVGIVTSSSFDKANAANVLAFNSGTIASAAFNKANSVPALATKASTLAQSGGDGAAMTFTWVGQSGQPTYLWGSNDPSGANNFVWNPSNFSVASAGNSTNLNGQAASYYTNIPARLGYTPLSTGGGTISGNLSVTGYITAGGNIYAYYSDQRLKTNINRYGTWRTVIDNVNAYTFGWNDIGRKLTKHNEDFVETGFIAQEIQKVYPEGVAQQMKPLDETIPFDENNPYLTIRNEKMIPVLFEAVKHLLKEVEDLKAQLNKKDA